MTVPFVRVRSQFPTILFARTTAADQSLGDRESEGGSDECGRHDGGMLLADNLLGDDLIVWLVLALGLALFVGNVLALLRPPPRPKPGELSRAPKGRSLLMALIGFLAALWSLGSLVAK